MAAVLTSGRTTALHLQILLHHYASGQEPFAPASSASREYANQLVDRGLLDYATWLPGRMRITPLGVALVQRVLWFAARGCVDDGRMRDFLEDVSVLVEKHRRQAWREET